MAINQPQTSKSPRRGRLPSAESKTGAEYEVLRTSFINGRIVNAKEVVSYDGVPGRYLRPLNAAAKKAKAQADEIRKQRRDATVQPLATNPTRAAAHALRDLDNSLRGIDPEADLDPAKEPESKLTAAEQKEFEKQAAHTHEQELARSQEAGGVTLQMTGKSPETVIPTTGPGAVANAQQQKAAEAKKAGK